MDAYQCIVCEYIYQGRGPGDRVISFESLPEEWKCPGCGSGKKSFVCIKKDEDSGRKD